MDEIGADFLITGEVLSQRPMSQNKRALQIIERAAEVEGKVVRPIIRKKPSSFRARDFRSDKTRKPLFHKWQV